MHLYIYFFGITASLARAYEYKTFWHETKIDHFSFAGNDTFKMRVLYNDDSFNHSDPGPAFLYTGNEGDIGVFANNTGLMWDWAPEFKALLIFAEHRFYGQSLPFGEKSFDSPKQYGYLTAEQAIADFADLVEHVKERWHIKKVVAFGGSYGGMLSAWMRIKYPWLIDAVLASSAPILQFQDLTPCGVFNKIVTKAFAKEGQKCADNIRKSWVALGRLAESGENGTTQIREKFRICQKILPSNYTVVRDWIYETYNGLAMANYPYGTDYFNKVPAYPVRVSCSFLNKDFENDADLLSGIYKAINVFHNFSGSLSCNDLLGGGGASDDEVWGIQKCNEMVMPVCGDGKEDMFFPYSWNFTQVRQDCESKYGMTPSLYIAARRFGGKDINATSNIIFSNGDLDPWSGGGLFEQLNPTLPIVVIKDGAHHYDLRPANPSDTPAVISARKSEKKYIESWIGSD